MTAPNRRRQSLLDCFTIFVALIGLYWFAASFFLAKKSLSRFSSCHEAETLLTDVLGLSSEQVGRLQDHNVLSRSSEKSRQGCWTPRRVESVMILLVDALRFDFCLYNLPESVGSRLHLTASEQHNQTTRLFRFVADPPTVTMQRLKALTTGGLPTFADISANFGGASLDEDSWVHQLMTFTRNDYAARGHGRPPRSAFVGDDTWVDLFPDLFTESYPYPSFNTRDLDTVDDGCIRHLPNLTTSFLSNEAEVTVVHFLGVDHVGHTYGPHNEHMDAKLKQMDAALANVLDRMDTSTSCQATLIFGDHGMTEDGNHGGGTEEEVSAALFVHVSPACGEMTEALSLERDSSLLWGASQTFSSIHQIDMVPTLSMMLGLPIPYANLGSVVPSLLPGYSYLDVATSLALNAAQLWRYLTIYSATANNLPIEELRYQLETAVSAYKEVIESLKQGSIDADKCNQASGLMKLFLTEALALGHRVWTRFDHFGMLGGNLVLLIAFMMHVYPLIRDRNDLRLQTDHTWEIATSFLAILFLSGLLTFSNSYIYQEQSAIMFFVSLIAMAISLRMRKATKDATILKVVLIMPFAMRAHELLVSGHGMDPSIQAHLVHRPAAFLLAGAILALIRWSLYQAHITKSIMHAILDCLFLLFLTGSWLEKSVADPSRHGFIWCRIALFWLCAGVPFAFHVDAATTESETTLGLAAIATLLIKVALAVIAVTGPSGAASLVFFYLQISSIYHLSHLTGYFRINTFVVATLCRLVTRHMFFATNHGCAFNRLQYSSAFIATNEFYFAFGGVSLFLNTFGWEIIGSVFGWHLGKRNGRAWLWRIFTAFQLLEALCSCASVSLLRRHLMVWDVYAPHFLFVSIFTVLNGLWLLSCTLLSLL